MVREKESLTKIKGIVPKARLNTLKVKTVQDSLRTDN